MAIDWGDVGDKVAQAVEGVVGAAWKSVAPGAATQFASIIAAGQQVEQQAGQPNGMQQGDYDALKLMQQRTLEGVLMTYEGIGLNVAQQAAAAAWGAVTTALKAAYPVLGFVL